MNRREVLKGGAALALTVALPPISSPVIDIADVVWCNWTADAGRLLHFALYRDVTCELDGANLILAGEIPNDDPKETHS